MWLGRRFTFQKQKTLIYQSVNNYIVKNCEGSVILFHLQSNKLACHSFMGAGRKHETPGSGQRTLLLTAQQAVRALACVCFSCPPPRPPSPMTDTHTSSELHYRRGTLSLGNLNLLKWAVGRLALYSGGNLFCPMLFTIQKSLKDSMG